MDKKTVLSLSKRAAQRQLHLITGREQTLQRTRTSWHFADGRAGFFVSYSSSSHYITASGTYKRESSNIERLTISTLERDD